MVKITQLCPTLCEPIDYMVHGILHFLHSGAGSLSLLQGIFPTQESNPGLPHCRWILYQQSHKGSPRILEWEPIPSPADLPDPGIEPRSPALQIDSLPTELSGKPWFWGRGGDFQDLGHRPLHGLLTVLWNCHGTSGCVISLADWRSRSSLVRHRGPIWF